MMIPGGNPVIAEPGLTPTLLVISAGPRIGDGGSAEHGEILGCSEGLGVRGRCQRRDSGKGKEKSRGEPEAK